MTGAGVPGGLRFAIASEGHIHLVPEEGKLEIGRSPQCAIHLDFPSISRLHARIWYDRGGPMIEDLGSRNGVYVNGVRLAAPQALRHSDRILIGDRMLTVVDPEEMGRPSLELRRARPTLSANRNTAINRSTFHVFFEAATAARSEGRVSDAVEAMGHLYQAMASTPASSKVDPQLIADVSAEMVMLAVVAKDAEWIDRLLRLRQRFEQPLEAPAVEELARKIATLPPAKDAGRKGYVQWMHAKPLTFTERAALKRLGDARGRMG